MASMQPVDVSVVGDSPSQPPIEGVVVRLFDMSGTVSYGQANTDSSGIASFLLQAPSTYQARFFKRLVNIKQPQYLEVTEDVGDNVFEIAGHIVTPPEAVDPRLCRCSGYFLAPSGAPLASCDIHIIAKFDPILLEGAAVLGERIRLVTNENGYVEVDLIRFAQYEVTVQGYEDCTRIIHVPDKPSANLPDLLFTVVSEIVLDPPGPYAISAGAENEIVVTPTVYATDGRMLVGTAIEDVLWTTLDGSVATIFNSGTTLTLRGLQPGTTDIQALRIEKGIIRIPNTPVLGQPIQVTVA